MPLEELIRKAADPLKAKKMGEDKDIPPRNDWKDKQEEVMYLNPLSSFSSITPHRLLFGQVRGCVGQVHRPQGHTRDTLEHRVC